MTTVACTHNAVEQLSGTVNKVIFRDPGGYAVLELRLPGQLLPIIASGKPPS